MGQTPPPPPGQAVTTKEVGKKSLRVALKQVLIRYSTQLIFLRKMDSWLGKLGMLNMHQTCSN